MKYKKRLAKLAARIKDWEARGGMNKESGRIHLWTGSYTRLLLDIVDAVVLSGGKASGEE